MKGADNWEVLFQLSGEPVIQTDGEEVLARSPMWEVGRSHDGQSYSGLAPSPSSRSALSAVPWDEGLPPVPAVLGVVVLQVITELLVGRNYALALLFITPMAMLMTQIAAPRPIGSLLFDRGLETVTGALIGALITLVGVLFHPAPRMAADA